MMENGFESKVNAFSSIDSHNSFKSDRKKDEESTKSESKKIESTVKEKHLTGFLKNSFKTLSIPKKSAAERDKNEPSRFLGEGVTFKAKLIGILEVEEARGDRMCQEALYELKMAVRAAGEHKQRINIVIAIDGIRLRDEKSGDCLHHHPVHKISFIAQDVADSRAFGYIFGSPDTSHRFFGIKTDKAASQVVMAMRDLFQAVYELKKREVEMAKQNIEQHQLRYGSSFFLDSVSASSSKGSSVDQIPRLKLVPREETNKTAKNKPQTVSVIADLMDLELELNSLQQGLSQMERLTPSDPFGPSPSLPKEDPFGDSFTPPPCITTPPPAKLPPPPTTGERRKVGGSTSSAASQPELHWFDKETQDLFSSEKSLNTNKDGREDRGPHESNSVSSSRDLYDIFVELDPLGTGRSKPYTDKKDFFQELKNPPKKQLKDLKSRISESDEMSYGINSSKSLFSDENREKTYDEHLRKYRSVDSDRRITLAEELAKRDDATGDPFETSFANFASFESVTSRHPAGFSAVPRRSPQSYLRQQSPPVQSESHVPYSLSNSTFRSSSNSSKSIYKSITSGDDVDSPSSLTNELFVTRRSPQWNRLQEDTSKQKIVIDLRKVLSNVDDTDKENDSPVGEEAMVLKNPDVTSPSGGNVSSDSFESIPEPPPRPITSPIVNQPPPLPPKKLQLPVTLKPPPPRPSSETTSHYDYIENYESVGSRQVLRNGNLQIPPLPAPARKPKFNYHDYDQRDFVRHRPQKQYSASSAASTESDYYLTPISKSRLDKQDERGGVKHSKPSLNITLSQLTSTGFEDLASILRIPASALSKMTLKELTECLSRLTEAECQKLERDMNHRNRAAVDDTGRKYRSLKESFDEDFSAGNFKANFSEKFPPKNTIGISNYGSVPPQIDKYAVFRELIDQDQDQMRASSFGATSPVPHKDSDKEKSAKSEDRGNNCKTNEQSTEQERNDSHSALRNVDTTKTKGENGNQKESESDAGGDGDAIIDSKDTYDISQAGDSSEVFPDKSSPVTRQLTEHDTVSTRDLQTEKEDAVEPSVKVLPSQCTTESDTQVLERSENDEVEDGCENNSSTEVLSFMKNEVGKNWAKFDSEQDSKERDMKANSVWQKESKDNSHKARPMEYQKQMNLRNRWNEYDDEEEEEDYGDDEEEEIVRQDEDHDLEEEVIEDDYGDDSEENWEGSKKSLASSWDESSWRENGWSDRDSLYDEGEASPASRYREQHFQLKKKGYHRKYMARHKKSAGQSPWEEESTGWAGPPRKSGNTPPYREYIEASERGYDTRKIRTPERKQRYDPKEENELTLLKMMLGKKRLKALEEQLFKHYHEQLNEKTGAQPNPKRYSNKMKGSSSSLFDRQYDDFGPSNRGTARRRAGKKYYHTQMRPKSAEKGRKPLLLQPEDTEELYISNTKNRYRRPYSQDELSISEEEKWNCRKSPTTFKKVPSSTSTVTRSRQHSQNSPFEDNFAPSGGTYVEFSSDNAADVDDAKLANTSTTTITTTTSSLFAASSLRNKNQQPPQSRYSSSSKTHTASSAYASCDNLKYSRTSRDSSQRQSPFDDDFTATDVGQQAEAEECVDRRRADDDVFFSNGITSPAGSVGAATSAVESSSRKARPVRSGGRNEHSRRTCSETSHTSGKYYENVELWKKKSPSDTSSMMDRHRKEADLSVASPKKGKRGGASEVRRHDPFNDNAHSYESRTVPRLGQKTKNKSRNNTNYDSGSDSTEPGADTNAFTFSDQHNRK